MNRMAQRILVAISIAFAVASVVHAAETARKPDEPEKAKRDLAEFVKSREARRYSAVPKKVLAFYYTWYGTPEVFGRWVHWEEVNAEKHEIGSSTHFPSLGAYDSHDPKVIAQHIRWAQENGVDGFICTWWRQKDIHDTALAKVLDAAAKEKFDVTIYWETTADRSGDRVKRAIGDLLYVLENYASHPAFLKMDGKPVIFVYGRVMGEIAAEQWPEIIQSVQKVYGKDFLLIADGYRPSYARVFDGIHAYNYANPIRDKKPDEMRAFAGKMFGDAVGLARERGKIACLTVLPGYDDTKIRKPGLATPRHDGETYRVLWEEAIAAKPDWVLITSWNEWHEGSEIEPSREDGDKYLKMTRKHAAEFEKASAK